MKNQRRVAPHTISFPARLMRPSILGLILLSGCASTSRPATDTPSNDRILGVNEQTGVVVHSESTTGPVVTSIHAPFKAVWAALPDAYAVLGIDLTVIDEPSGTIGNRSFVRMRTLGGKRASEYFHCGSSLTGMRADEGRLIVSAVSKATAGADGQTLLSTTVSSAVQTTAGTSTQTIACASTGMLEESIRSAVAHRTGAP